MTELAAKGGRIFLSPEYGDGDYALFDVYPDTASRPGVCTNLTREQGTALRDALNAWLDPQTPAQDSDEVPLSVHGRIDIDAVRTDLVKVSNPHMATAARGVVTSRLLSAIPEMVREIRQYRTQTPAPVASSPVPQAATGTVADPSAAAAPVARDTGMCRCGHPIGEHDADGNGWCTGSTVWVDAQSDWLACDCKGYAPVGGAS